MRALMQRGDYRRALAFAGHTAFAHSESSDGAALYALLLRVGRPGRGGAAPAHAGAAAWRPTTRRCGARATCRLRRSDDADLAALGAIVAVGSAPPAARRDGRQCDVAARRHARGGAIVGCSAPRQIVWLRNGLGRTRAGADRAAVGLRQRVDPVAVDPADRAACRVGTRHARAFSRSAGFRGGLRPAARARVPRGRSCSGRGFLGMPAPWGAGSGSTPAPAASAPRCSMPPAA